MFYYTPNWCFTPNFAQPQIFVPEIPYYIEEAPISLDTQFVSNIGENRLREKFEEALREKHNSKSVRVWTA